jgi:membrane protein
VGKNTGVKEKDPNPGVDFVKEIYSIWIAERPTTLAAALAYFGLFSFAPVIYVTFTIAGIFIDQAALMERFMTRLESTLGPGVTQFVQDMLASLTQKNTGGTFLFSLISFFALLLAASGVFFQIQFALNTVWKVPTPTQGATLRMIRQRLFSFLIVISIGLLLVAAVVLSVLVNWLSAISILRFDFQPSLTLLSFFALASLSFGLLYKLLPDVKVAWRDVWVGAAAAACLVTLGGWLILFFLSHTSLSSALEATGSFIILLTGFYYFAQIFLLGAILTRLYAQRYGSLRQPPTEQPPV